MCEMYQHRYLLFYVMLADEHTPDILPFGVVRMSRSE